MHVEVKKLFNDAKLPTKAYEHDAGWDLYAYGATDWEYEISRGETVKISTGLAFAIPEGYVGLIWDRSGLGSKDIHKLAGVLDSGYRGELIVILHYLYTPQTEYSIDKLKIKRGDKIAQMLIQEVPVMKMLEVSELSQTERGKKGFGSSG